MSDKNNSETTITEEFKDQSTKHNLSKFEFDLYHDEYNIVEKIIRVKRISMPKGEKWKIMNDNKLVFTIEGNKLSKKETSYLQTIEGFNFILSKAKSGIKSLNSFRVELKKIIEPTISANKTATKVKKVKKLPKKSKK